jgi:hypothetical protein
VVRPDRVAHLDARPLLAAGEDPLARILAALRALPPRGQLTVVAPFEPVPLVGLLARQGWASWTRWDAEDCLVTFVHAPGSVGTAATATAAAATAADAPLPDALLPDGDGWCLDVSAFPPPEPMRRVLAAVDAGKLPLRVLHAREPALLYPKLVERGLTWTVLPRAGGAEVHVRRA